jgi:hypothetical protein
LLLLVGFSRAKKSFSLIIIAFLRSFRFVCFIFSLDLFHYAFHVVDNTVFLYDSEEQKRKQHRWI